LDIITSFILPAIDTRLTVATKPIDQGTFTKVRARLAKIFDH